MISRRKVGGDALELVASLDTDFVQHDLSPEGSEMLSGSFTPVSSTVRMAVSSALAIWGTARAAVLLYVGQPDEPGERIYDTGGQPLPGVQAFSMGSVGCESGWATTSYRMVDIDVDPSKHVTWVILAGIIGASHTVPTGRGPVRMTITPDGTKAYVANVVDGTLTPIVLGRPGYSFFNELQPQDEARPPIDVGPSPIDVASHHAHVVAGVGGDRSPQVTVVDVETDAVRRRIRLSGDRLTSISLGPDGRFAFAATAGGEVHRVDVASGAVNTTIVAPGRELRGVAVNETVAFVGDHDAGKIHRIAVDDLEYVGSTDVGGNVTVVRLAPDGAVWSASRGTDRLQCVDTTGTIIAEHRLPYAGVNDLAICAPVPAGAVPGAPAQPVRTAFVAFDGRKWCEYNIGGTLAGQLHSIHKGELPGGESHSTGIAVNDYGEIWIVQNGLDRVWKFPGGRVYCRAGFTPGQFFGEYLDVHVQGAALS